jgi:hypothetical protein
MEKYIRPEMEIIEFEAEDVITTSGLNEGDPGDEGNEDFHDFFHDEP